MVDETFIEESLEQKREYIERYAADVLVMGDDWAGKFDDLGDICKVVYLTRTPSVSTTALIEKISTAAPEPPSPPRPGGQSRGGQLRRRRARQSAYRGQQALLAGLGQRGRRGVLGRQQRLQAVGEGQAQLGVERVDAVLAVRGVARWSTGR